MRKFKVILTQDNKSGPFDILYNINDNIYIANLFSSGLPAENIPSSSLGDGVDIFIPFSTNTILIKNKKETCDTFQQITVSPIDVPDIPLVIYPIYIPTPSPTPNPTPSPTPAPTSVSLSYGFRVTSANNLDTVCNDNIFNITISGSNPSFFNNDFFYTNSSLNSAFNGNGFLYKLSESPLYVGIQSDGFVYVKDSCGINPPTPPPASTPAPTISTPAPILSTPAPILSTPAPTVSYQSYDLYFCGTTTPASQRVPYNGNLDNGVIIKGSNNICYTIAGPTIVGGAAITINGEYQSCEECNQSISTPAPTNPPPPSTPAPTSLCRSYDYIGGVNGGTIQYTPCGGGSNIEINVFENEDGSFCSIDNQYSIISGNITINPGNVC